MSRDIFWHLINLQTHGSVSPTGLPGFYFLLPHTTCLCQQGPSPCKINSNCKCINVICVLNSQSLKIQSCISILIFSLYCDILLAFHTFQMPANVFIERQLIPLNAVSYSVKFFLKILNLYQALISGSLYLKQFLAFWCLILILM